MSAATDRAIAEAELATRLALGLRYHRGLKHGVLAGLVVGACTALMGAWLITTMWAALARGCA